jgi:hypothetical protein
LHKTNWNKGDEQVEIFYLVIQTEIIRRMEGVYIEPHYTFWLGCWAIGAILAACRIAIDNSRRNFGCLVAVSVQGGFWSFAATSLISIVVNDITSHYSLGLAVSSIVGLLGKEQDALLRWGLKKFFGIDLPIPTDTKDK